MLDHSFGHRLWRKGWIFMLNLDQKKKRQLQIEAHKLKRTERHQYPIRLTLEQYSRLKKMAGNSPMSDVVNRGIETEWTFYTSVQKLIKELPSFKIPSDIEKWRLERFKDSPELLSLYVKPTVIAAYSQELFLKRKLEMRRIDNLSTVNYAVKQIGNNINQLARKANSGVDVPKDELRLYTKEVIKLRNAINAIFGDY